MAILSNLSNISASQGFYPRPCAYQAHAMAAWAVKMLRAVKSTILSIHAFKLWKTGYSYVQRIIGVDFAHRTSKHHLYIWYDVCKHSEVTLEVAFILFYSLTYLRSGVSEQDFGRSWVVNQLVNGVSVPRHFLNDTNILYVSHVVRTNTWKSKLKCRSSIFIAKCTWF